MDYNAIRTAALAAVTAHTFANLAKQPVPFRGLRFAVDGKPVGWPGSAADGTAWPFVMVKWGPQLSPETVSGTVSNVQPSLQFIGGIPWTAATEAELAQQEQDIELLATDLWVMIAANRNLAGAVGQMTQTNVLFSVEPIRGAGGVTKHLCATVFVRVVDYRRTS